MGNTPRSGWDLLESGGGLPVSVEWTAYHRVCAALDLVLYQVRIPKLEIQDGKRHEGDDDQQDRICQVSPVDVIRPCQLSVYCSSVRIEHFEI